MLDITSRQSFEVKFKPSFIQNFSQGVEKIALLATTEYEGFFKNGGIGTYYAALSRQLAAEGWYVILLLCLTTEDFQGESPVPALKHVFSTHNIEQVLDLQPVHLSILSEVQKIDSLDYQSFCCLFFTQAVANHFKDSLIYVEFPEMCGLGFRTIQGKNSGVFASNCITAVTLHSGHEWIYEANENYAVTNSFYFWQACHYEQYSYENADLAFFPSYFIKSKVESYGWRRSLADHLPYFVPLIDLDSLAKSKTIQDTPNTEKVPIVFFGRLEERKGLCEFLAALKLLNSSLSDKIYIIFLGKIIQLSSSKLQHLNSQQYIEQELNDKFEYSIFSNFSSKEAIQFVNSLPSPIVCLASPQDNFPNTALEMGQLPVSLVVSDTGGFRETLKLLNRSSGVRWFEPENSSLLSESIAQAILAYPEKPQVSERVFLERVNQNLLEQRLEYLQTAFSQSASSASESPTVTIGVTCFNLGKYLLDCLKSLAQQTYSNLDIIVLDDGSNDEYTLEIIERAKSLFPKYKFVRLDKNVGLGAARNYLIQLAQGEYFIPFDADNIALPFMVETFVKAIRTAKADAAVCPQMKFGDYTGILSFTGGSLPKLLQTNLCGDACSLFSTKLLREFQHSENRKVATHDWQIFSAALVTGRKVTYFPYPLYLYRVRSDAMLRFAEPLRDQYQLRQYLSQIEPSNWSRRQIYMLVMAVQQLINELAKTQSALQQARLEVQQVQVQANAQLHQANAQLYQANAQLHQAQTEAVRSQQRITAMETSKFWQLRKAWFRFKRALGIPGDE